MPRRIRRFSRFDQNVERTPWFLQMRHIARQGTKPLGRHAAGCRDNPYIRPAMSDLLRQIDAVAQAGKSHVSEQKHDSASGLQNRKRGLGAVAFDYLQLAFLQQYPDEFPLRCVLAYDQGTRLWLIGLPHADLLGADASLTRIYFNDRAMRFVSRKSRIMQCQRDKARLDLKFNTAFKTTYSMLA
jgi:hypothetical protein